MKTLFLPLLLCWGMAAGAQTYADRYTRPLGAALDEAAHRFNIRLKYKVDTTGLRLSYADFRVRPYSAEETLHNLLSPFDLCAIWQKDNQYRIIRYEHPRRNPSDGRKLLAWLSSKYADRQAWEARRDTLRACIRARLGIDSLLKHCSQEAPELTPVRRFDGYTVQNFRMQTVNGHTLCGSIYAPLTKKKEKRPLIICPNGHFKGGRYGEVQQLRLATLARMGAVCVSYDLWGWGESVDETGSDAHETAEAHTMQTLNGLRVLDFMLRRKDIDSTRVGVNGGSGGGSQVVLLAALDSRFTAVCPVVSMSSWFDGGCPCESGMPIHLAAGGTCNPEIAAISAPKPMLVVSDGGDWTATTPELEYPYLRRIYAFYGCEDSVSNVHLPQERHDFGPNKRNAVYRFFIDTFRLDASRLDESRVTVESEAALRFSSLPTKQRTRQ